MFDIDKTSKVSFKNIKQIAMDVGLRMNEKELYEIFELADRDGDGLLDFKEFFTVMKKKDDFLEDWSDEEGDE